jgi:hypothetical protein
MIVVALPKVPRARSLSLRLIYTGAICCKIPSKATTEKVSVLGFGTFGNVTAFINILTYFLSFTATILMEHKVRKRNRNKHVKQDNGIVTNTQALLQLIEYHTL